MSPTIAIVTIVVRDYDEALAFYVQRLGFEVVEDTDRGTGKRWIRVRPAGSTGAEFLLAKAVTPEQLERVGDQTGGRVMGFIQTDDFERDWAAWRSRGVVFIGEPRREDYGTVAVFQDLYGNRFDLIQGAG